VVIVYLLPGAAGVSPVASALAPAQPILVPIDAYLSGAANTNRNGPPGRLARAPPIRLFLPSPSA